MARSISWARREAVTFEVRRVPMFQALTWVRRGWDDLRSLGSSSIAHGVLIVTLGAVLLTLGSTHPYLIAASISGYLLVGPIMTMGFCELSRRRLAGEPAGFDEALQPVARNSQALFQFGAILAGIAILWFAISEMVLQPLLRPALPSLDVAIWGGFASAASSPQILAYVATGALLAGLVFTLSVVAIPMIIDRNASAIDAMRASVKATVLNLQAMLVWSALIVVLTAVGFATALIGLIVVAPLLGHATWHAYKDLIR